MEEELAPPRGRINLEGIPAPPLLSGDGPGNEGMGPRVGKSRWAALDDEGGEEIEDRAMAAPPPRKGEGSGGDVDRGEDSSWTTNSKKKGGVFRPGTMNNEEGEVGVEGTLE